jgi:hypothetical protein
MSRSGALEFFRLIESALVKIHDGVKARSLEISQARSRLDVEIAKGRAAHERLPLRGVPAWDLMVFDLRATALEDFRNQLFHYLEVSRQIVELLADDANWQVNGIEAGNESTRSMTALIMAANSLVSGFTYSLDAVIEHVWRYGAPVGARNPYADLHATVVPFASSLKRLWELDTDQASRLVPFTDSLSALCRAVEHNIKYLIQGIGACTEWNQQWLDPLSQFRERYNAFLVRLESHFSSVIPGRIPAFARIDEAQSLRFGSPGPLLRSATFGPGERFQATDAIRQIIKTATSEVLIVDNYTSADTLALLFSAPTAVAAKMLTYRREGDYPTMAARFRGERGVAALETRESARDFHDRYLMIDGRDIFHLGASIKDLGRSVFSFTQKSDPAEIARIQAPIATSWAGATVIQ